MINIFFRTIQFTKEVREEMAKVTWPDRKTTIKFTLIVIGMSLAVALFLGGLDFLFSSLLTKYAL